MGYQQLRQRVYEANMRLVSAGLVTLTWGNASEADRLEGVFAIKPSGVEYDKLRPEDIVVLSLVSGKVVDSAARPSSDTPTHLHLYQELPSLGGIIHTHSTCATSFAQAHRAIPCFGTTHADHFHGSVPLTRPLTDREVQGDYELNTGRVIVECLRQNAIAEPLHVPGILVASHGPFAWGANAAQAAENGIALEAIANMAIRTLALNPQQNPVPQALLDKHFLRKHGPRAYYGQNASASPHAAPGTL